MMVTTGSRVLKLAGSASLVCSRDTSSSNEITLASKPNSRQISFAMLISSGWLMVDMMPRPSSLVMMSLAFRSIFSDSSLTVTPSVIVISCRTSGITGGGGIAGLGGGAGAAWGLGLGATALAEGAAPA